MVEARLIVQEGNEVEIVDLSDEPVTIGRGRKNTFRVASTGASRFHCRIELAKDGYRLVDLSSHNGTRVNGRTITRCDLKTGDRIEVGRTVIYYREEEPKEEAEPSVPSAAAPESKRRTRKPAHSSRYAADPRAKVERVLARVFEDEGLDGLLGLRTAVENFVEDRSSAISGRGTTRENLARLQESTRAITSELDLGKLLTLVVDSVIELTQAERGFLLLQSLDKLEIRTARNLDREAIRNPGRKISRSIAEEVAETGKPLITINAQRDERLSSSGSVTDLKLRSVMAVAFKLKDRVTGVLYLDIRFEEGVFSKVDLPLAEAFADQASIAVENARLVAVAKLRQEELARAKERVDELNRVLNEKVRRQSAELDEVKQILKERQDELEFKYSYENIIGGSSRMRDVFRLLDKVTDTDVPVLVQGDSGTGKELVARAIHFNGPRKDGAFISENCAAIPESLLESELFGYKRGAFTGADRDKRGLIEAANGGTLVLDEIGDMALEMQGKLLRALDEGEIRPLGGKETVRVDVRIISATNQDLRRMQAEGKFREDLYYRLAVITVQLPPLRDRREDVPLLVNHFLAQGAKKKGVEPREIGEEAMALLVGYDWPGNVRQLRNEVQRAVALADHVIEPEILSEEIRLGSLPHLLPDRFAERTLKDVTREVVQSVERQVVQEALTRTNWKKTAAARMLGISRPTLDSKIHAYSLKRS